MSLSDETLLDLDGIAQRASSFRFDLLDPSLATLGTLYPFRDSAPKIDNNMNRAVKRTMSGLALSPSDTAAINVVTARVRANMVLSNGSVHPLGVFMFANAPRVRESWGVSVEGDLVDQTVMLDQATEQTIAYPQGTSIASALAEQFEVAGVPLYEIDPITNVVGSPLAWPAGESRLKVMNELCALAGCYSVHFDARGYGRVMVVPDLTLANVDVTYDVGTATTGRIYRGSIVENDDLLDSPNRFVVIDSSNRDAPVVGYYDIPDDAPNSIAARGFAVVSVIDAPGVGTVAAAEQRGRAAYAQSRGTLEWADFDGPPDPRHDTFAIVSYLGNLYREQQWGLTCSEGEAMSHSLRRVYA